MRGSYILRYVLLSVSTKTDKSFSIVETFGSKLYDTFFVTFEVTKNHSKDLFGLFHLPEMTCFLKHIFFFHTESIKSSKFS